MTPILVFDIETIPDCDGHPQDARACRRSCPTATWPRSRSRSGACRARRERLPAAAPAARGGDLVRAEERRRPAHLLARRARGRRGAPRSSASSTASRSTCRSSCPGTAAASTCRCCVNRGLIHGVRRGVLLGHRRRRREFATTTTSAASTTATATSWMCCRSTAGAARRSTSSRASRASRASSAWAAARCGRATCGGGIEAIRNYCEADIVNTYLLFLRFQLMRCAYTPERYAIGARAPARHARQAHRAPLAGVPVALEGVTLRIESLDAEGRGVARNPEGKVIFVEGALPGEEIDFQVLRKKTSFEIGRLTKVLGGSSSRQTPRCPHFGVCGGCACSTSMRARRWPRSSACSRRTWRASARCSPRSCCRSSTARTGTTGAGRAWACATCPRKAARWSGFREKRSSYVADMRECDVLPRRISDLIPPLRALVEALSIRARLPQIEVAVGDDDDVLVLRHLDPLTAADEGALRAVRRAARHRALAAARRAGQRASVPSGAERALLRAARVRRAPLLPADRFHPGEPRREPRAGVARGAPARPAAGRARRGPLLRPRQLLAAARRARRAGDRHRRQRRARRARARRTPRATASRRSSRSMDLFKPDLSAVRGPSTSC